MKFPRLHPSELAELGLYALTVAACTLVYGCQQASGAVPVLVEPVEDRVSVIEKNNFYDGEGRLVFAQWIFRDAHSIVAWRLVKPEHRLARWRDGWLVEWNDGPLLRRVLALSFVETWTQEDVELLERELLPQEERRGLSTPLRKKPLTTNPPFVREIPAEGP